ncbi:hypothetical protein [Sandaracinus amylolyticus]|uniref:Lipoprotein n=1 Tax=Sandaracinus amylolyticus TaxID=927083 RepID=A0A0F6SEV2_9BACT|nr:hypothetical protein [Sandaracinus amylolyticus]AKF05839.1 hypothetical protein DB32_002988 [Sandaracinus amylolyticus]
MRHAISISVLASVLLALSGCGGDEGAGGDTDAGGGADAGAQDSGATEENTDAGSDAGPPPVDAGPAADVEWQIEPEPLTIDRDISLSYGYSYTLAVTGDPFVYSVRLYRCMNIATREPVCWDEEMPNLPDTYGVRWGIDPTQYGIGENSYTFRVVVRRGEEIVDEDSIELTATVTACSTCVGSGNEPEEE